MTPTTEELEALVAGTTPGPWAQGSGWIGRLGPEFECLISYGYCADDVGTDYDAELMALAPTLAREVLALRAELAALRALPPVEVPWVETAPGRWESGAGDVVLREPCGGVSHWQARYPWPTGPIPRAVLLRALEGK